MLPFAVMFGASARMCRSVRALCMCFVCYNVYSSSSLWCLLFSFCFFFTDPLSLFQKKKGTCVCASECFPMRETTFRSVPLVLFPFSDTHARRLARAHLFSRSHLATMKRAAANTGIDGQQERSVSRAIYVRQDEQKKDGSICA